VTEEQVATAEAGAGPSPTPADVDGDTIFEAPALLRILWADPKNMPEHLALWSLKYFGPRAAAAVDRLHGAHPDDADGELERLAVERQTRVCMTEGAFVGGPFILLIPVAFCAALLAQAQMAFELAAINGYAATDQMRAADLLVLQGAYGSTDDAHAALQRLVRDPKRREGKRLPRGSRWNMIKRMAFLLGVLGPGGGEKPSRLVTWFRYALLGATFLVGLVLPLVWVPYMAVSMRRSALQMGARATEFYAARRSDEGVTVRRAQVVHVGISAGLVRMGLLILAPVVAGVVAVLAGADLGTGKWVSALIFLLALSVLATCAYLGWRWWRHRRRVARQTTAAGHA
jgi:hypothetical protein